MTIAMNDCRLTPSSNGDFSARVLTSAADIEALRSSWERLSWNPNADMDFFLLISEMRKQEPRIVVVCRGPEVVAIAAARIVPTTVKCSFGYRTLYAPRVRELAVVHGGVMGTISEEVPSLLLKALISILENGEADVLALHLIKTDSPLAQLALRYSLAWCRGFSPETQSHHTLILPKRREDLFMNMKSKHRSDLRRLSKVLEKKFQGQVRVQCFRSPDEATRFCAEAEAVSRKSYHTALGFGFVYDEEQRRRALLWARRGSFLGYMMYIGDKPCAYWCGPLYGSVYHLASTAFDPEYRQHEIGTVLLTRVIEDMFNQGRPVTEVDFGRGDAGYKRTICTDQWQETTVYIFAKSGRSIGINLIRTPILGAGRVVQFVSRRLRFEQRIKTMWRRHAENTLKS